MGQGRNDKASIGKPVLDSSVAVSLSTKIIFLYLTMGRGMLRDNSG